MAAKKSQDLRDIINAANKLFSKPSPRGATAQASAVLNKAQSVSNKSAKAVSDAGKAGAKSARAVSNYAVGDPSKGVKHMISTTGVWLIPYGKGYKLVNKAIKGAKYYKSAKAARGAVKGAIVLGADTALNAGVNKLPSGKKP